MLEGRIRVVALPGTVIPKPAAREPFRVKGDGTRRGEPALIYFIRSHSKSLRQHQKGVTWQELERAYAGRLSSTVTA